MSPYWRALRARMGQELLLLPGVAAVIRDESGRILLQERSSGDGWSLPAGSIEPGETPMQAVQREVLEETGLSVAVRHVIDVFGGAEFRHTYPNGDVVEYTVVLYRCDVLPAELEPLGPETRSLRYFAAHEMPRLAFPYPLEALFGEPAPRLP